MLRAFLERYVYVVKDSFGNFVEADHEDKRWEQTLVVGCGVQGTGLGEHQLMRELERIVLEECGVGRDVLKGLEFHWIVGKV